MDPGPGRKAGVNSILGITRELDCGMYMVMLSDWCFLGCGNGALISFPFDLQLETPAFRIAILNLCVGHDHQKTPIS